MVNKLNKSVSLLTWGQLFAVIGHSLLNNELSVRIGKEIRIGKASGLAKHPERLTSSTTSGRTRVYAFTLK